MPEQPASPGSGDDPSVSDDLGSRLVQRAERTDRADRFATRLEQVERSRDQRVARGRVLRLVSVVATAGVGALLVLLLDAAAIIQGATGGAMAFGAFGGAVVGIVGPTLRERLAARRGAQAWDWHRQRHVLLGDPSSVVQDADRPAGGPLPPPRR